MRLNFPYLSLLLGVLLFFLSSALPCSLCFADDDDARAVEVSQKKLAPFLKQHCLRCHNQDEQSGDFRIDTIPWSIKTNADAEQWQDVLDVLNSGNMPPSSEPRPGEDELLTTLSQLTKTLATARAVLSDSGASVPIRQLNKREYINTIHHLFGLNLNAKAVPDSVRGEHFDTLGESQFFDVPTFETYLELGTKISREGLRWSGRPHADTKTKRIQPEIELAKYNGNPQDKSQPRSDEGKYLLAGGKRQVRDVGVRFGPDPRAHYRINIRAGLVDNPHPLRRSVLVTETSGVLGIPGTNLGTLRIHGSVDNPQTESIVVPYRALGPSSKVSLSISESRPRLNDRGFRLFMNQLGEKRAGSIWVDWVEVEGPLYPSRQSVLGELIAKDKPREVVDLKKVDVHGLLEDFAFEAFRRQKPKPQYVDALVEHYDRLRQEGVPDVQALSQVMGIVLASPRFLYLEEQIKGRSGRLTAHSFATRLAYFLWSSPPDEELYALTKSNEIFEPTVLRQQVNRMLNDEKADAFYDGFMSQWAELERLDGISVNLKDYPSFNAGYELAIRREIVEFFKVLVKENLSVDQFIDSDFIVVNALLAEHYGLPASKYSNEFEKVKLPTDDPRGGMITQAGFLTMGSDGNRTSPVIRGALLMEKLLNQPPPPPPPNVPELAEASDKPISNREIVELHQKQTACASCHKRMDPIGFGLENFDVVGRWRDFEEVGNKKVKIEASATLVTGVEFKNLEELRTLLLSQRHHLAKGMIESMLSYGLGRNKSFSDQNAVKEILSQSWKEDFRMRDLIMGIVNSKPFQHK